MLRQEERGLLLAHCRDHPVAACPQCSERVTFERIGADVIMGRRDFCPICRADLTSAIRQHLAECTLMRVQEREARGRLQQTLQEGGSSGPGWAPA